MANVGADCGRGEGASEPAHAVNECVLYFVADFAGELGANGHDCDGDVEAIDAEDCPVLGDRGPGVESAVSMLRLEQRNCLVSERIVEKLGSAALRSTCTSWDGRMLAEVRMCWKNSFHAKRLAASAAMFSLDGM